MINKKKKNTLIKEHEAFNNIITDMFNVYFNFLN